MTKTDFLQITFEGTTIRAINKDGRFYFNGSDIKRAIDYNIPHYSTVKPVDKIKEYATVEGEGRTKGSERPQVFLTIQGITDWLMYYHKENKTRLMDLLILESGKEDFVVQTKLEFDAKEVDKFEKVFRDPERISELTSKIDKLKKALDHEMAKPTKEQMKAYLQGMGL
ncbi:hypothetical protein PP654_gp041 [Bacillus phage v_B-Bak10]|uniref:Uncharacterized protein n=1 Tax=Bacillus phage v_B-Bak10 TaxID=2094736 RepID=A0A385IK47_9CAUD|nr:hypothetical protein PP654_gp041 [Bacillus phage v_B-Bak10]AXY83240.1 hypothetical protein vBBBak10_101 [Bacillus phage v_B-Bak10]